MIVNWLFTSELGYEKKKIPVEAWRNDERFINLYIEKY